MTKPGSKSRLVAFSEVFASGALYNESIGSLISVTQIREDILEVVVPKGIHWAKKRRVFREIKYSNDTKEWRMDPVWRVCKFRCMDLSTSLWPSTVLWHGLFGTFGFINMICLHSCPLSNSHHTWEKTLVYNFNFKLSENFYSFHKWIKSHWNS